MTWVPVTAEGETWTARTAQSDSWSAVTAQVETWTEQGAGSRVFSPLVFSHDFYTGLRVFAIGSSAGVWDGVTSQSEVWASV